MLQTMTVDLKKPNPVIISPENSGLKLMQLSDDEFNLIRTLVYERFGINLTEAKRSLVVGRLQKTLRLLRFDSFMEFYEHLMRDTSGSALDALINQISTNHTFFYREGAHYMYFRDIVLPEIKSCLQHDHKRDLRVWCAGCSSGEEAYTIVIEMMEYFQGEYSLWDAGVLGTDISAKALNKAVADYIRMKILKTLLSMRSRISKKTRMIYGRFREL